MIYSKDTCSSLGYQALTKSQGMTNKSLFYANEKYANELICIFIQFFKQRMSSPFMWSLSWIHQQRMQIVRPHFGFSTQIRIWPRCQSNQGISQKWLVIVTPNLHKYIWKYSTSLQYTCYLQNYALAKYQKRFLSSCSMLIFYEKLHNLCKWEICKLANQHVFVTCLKKLVNTFDLIPYSWKMGWIVIIGVSKTMLFKCIKNMG